MDDWSQVGFEDYEDDGSPENAKDKPAKKYQERGQKMVYKKKEGATEATTFTVK